MMDARVGGKKNNRRMEKTPSGWPKSSGRVAEKTNPSG